MFWAQFKSTKKAMKNLPVTAKAVLTVRGGRVLLLRKTGSSIFDLPGGRIERNESMYRGLRREIWEETGIKVKEFDFVASWVKEGRGMHPRLMLIFRAYLAKSPKKIDVVLSDEHDFAEFLPIEKALKRNMHYGYKQAIATSQPGLKLRVPLLEGGP